MRPLLRRPTHGEPKDARDPVASYFRSQRAGLQPVSADDADWRDIMAATGRSHAGLPRHTAAVLTVITAVLLLVLGLWSVSQRPFEAHDVRSGAEVEPATGRDAAATEPARTDPPQAPAPVPGTFRTWSVSNGGNRTVYALGSAECREGICPTLVRSPDDGTSWKAVHTFTGTDTSSLQGAVVPSVQPNGALSQVRFADPQVGYVFGGDLHLTKDRGASFEKVIHPGETVLDLEIWQGQVYLLTADDCVQGSCAGTVHLSRADVSTPSSFTQVATASLVGTIEAGSLTVKKDIVLVETAGESLSAMPPLRLAGDRLHAVRAQACGGAPIEAVTIAASGSDDVLGVCRSDPNSSKLAVLRSTDGGQSWFARSDPVLDQPDVGAIAIAAADRDHLVVGAGGPRARSPLTGPQSKRSLQVSTDGGLSFTTASVPDAAVPASGFDFVGSPGGKEFYAVSRTSPSYLASTDFGERWRIVDPAREKLDP